MFHAANLALKATRTMEVEKFIIALCEQLEEVQMDSFDACTFIVLCRREKR